MKYEILKGTKVINTIMADEAFMLAQYPTGNYRLVVEEPEVVAPVVTARHITQLAFLNRFTDAEAITIDLASQGATVQAATMRRYQSKVTAAAYIDLDREDTRAGVIALEAAGVLDEGRALQILDGAIAEQEKFKG